MKKITFLLFFILWTVCAQAQALPDNIYFKAMKHEMKRSLQKLRRPGVPAPFYIAYKLENIKTKPEVIASLGALYPSQVRDDLLIAYAWVDIGTPQHDSMGYKHEGYYDKYAYRPQADTDISKSYEGIRHALWKLTDDAYVFAAETYQQKQAYLRNKQADKNPLPDFMPQKQSHYVGELSSWPVYDEKELQKRVKVWSAQGKAYPFLEQFSVGVQPLQREEYYLNTRGGFYQKSMSAVRVFWIAKLRNKDGFQQPYEEEVYLPDLSEESIAWIEERNKNLLSDLQALYDAKKAQAYIGPVVLAPRAAGQFIHNVLVKNIQNLNPLLSADGKDKTAGLLRDKENMRVVSDVIDVYDEPEWDSYGGWPLGGFMPVDDEGVKALASDGYILDLPRTGRPFGTKQPGNGHARATLTSLPRERLTNVWVQAKNPLTAGQLKDKILEKCKELGMDYFYVLYDFPDISKDEKKVQWAQRIYTADGRAELVYGLQLNNVTPRSLRDIAAAGDESYILHVSTHPYVKTIPQQSVVSPGLLLEELELEPDNTPADNPPFVKKP